MWNWRRSYSTSSRISCCMCANDSSFNEALATTVEEEGVRRWLRAQGREADLSGSSAAAGALSQGDRPAERDARRAARALRLRPAACADARDEARRIRSLRSSFALLKADWGGHAPFEAWFAEDLNNAHLASIATYFDCVPGFRARARGGGRRPSAAFYCPESARAREARSGEVNAADRRAGSEIPWQACDTINRS